MVLITSLVFGDIQLHRGSFALPEIPKESQRVAQLSLILQSFKTCLSVSTDTCANTNLRLPSPCNTIKHQDLLIP